MNRRKPKVVIPQNFEELHATSQRVHDALESGDSIIEGNPATAPLKLVLDTGIAAADASAATVFVVNEASQTAVSERNTLFEQMRDLLIQIRDFSIANNGGDRSAPGRCGFEVVQSTSDSGNARVVIPENPDQFIALGFRVATCTIQLNDPDTVGIAGDLAGLTSQAQTAHNNGIFKREEWQLLISQRREISRTLTVVLRKLRDLAFAIAGPRNYESVSTVGFVVQSDATQNGSSQSSVGSPMAPPEPTVLFSDLFSALEASAPGFTGAQSSFPDDPLSQTNPLTSSISLADAVAVITEFAGRDGWDITEGEITDAFNSLI